ncbi:MAG: aminopeptidase P family protein [Pirellulales bacterium]
MPDYLLRRTRLRQLLSEAGCSGMLVSNVNNVRYLTGFTGDDSLLLITDREELLLSDPRYEIQLGQECPGLPLFIRKPSELTMTVVGQQLKNRSLTNLVVETGSMTVDQFDQIACELGTEKIVKGKVRVEALREIKDLDEIATIRRAIDVAERVFTCVKAQLTSRQTELDVSNELERLVRQLGGSGCSFVPIVAVGPRAALPHARAGKSEIGSDCFVLIDWGATVDGYRSDLTRVLLTSKIPPKFLLVYEKVLAAQKAAIAAMAPGVMVSEVDRIARSVIEAAGMGELFNHGLGHGIGLDIHEAPRLGKNHDRPLLPGMVVTVEPGIYISGWGGVRIEDDVLITESGCEVLSSLPSDLASNTVQLLS